MSQFLYSDVSVSAAIRKAAIDDNTTLDEILKILQGYPEAAEAADREIAAKKTEEKRAKIREWISREMDAFDRVQEEKEEKQTEEAAEAAKSKRRPGAIQLRTTVPMIAKKEIGTNVSCELFSNGYAIYDNGNRKTVLWVPECVSTAYYFNELTESERRYLTQYAVVNEDVMRSYPWHIALVIAGENQIERNMEHPKSKASRSDIDLEEDDDDEVSALQWVGAYRFDDPETAYLKKEAREERSAAICETQKEVCRLWCEEGYTTREIAELLHISQPAVVKRIKRAEETLKKSKKNF